MFKQKILMNPDAAAGGGGQPTPAPAVAPAPAPAASPGLSARSALASVTGGNSPRAELDAFAERLASRQPKATMPAAPAPAAPAAPTPAPDPAPAPAPAPAAAPAAPAAPAPAQKYKFGGKEYTAEELEAVIAKANQPAAPAPAAAPTPAPAPQNPEDPKVIEAQRQQEQQRILREERAWIESRHENFKPFVSVSPELMEEIMVGGKEGAERLEAVLRQNAAASELAARKSILTDIAPAYDAVLKKVESLVQAQQRAAQEQVEARFFGVADRADYRQHADLCRAAADRLAREFPNEVAAMTEEEFFTEITKQVDYNLTKQAQALFGQGVTDWRQLRQQFAQPAAAPVAAPAPAAAPVAAPAPAAAPVAAPAPAAAAAAPASRAPVATPVVHQFGTPLPPAVVTGNPAQAVTPPAVNAPAGGFASGPQAPDWHNAVNERMRGGRRS